MTDQLLKSSIRAEAVLHRDRIDPRSEDAEDAAQNFIESVQPQPGQVIALYWPKGREFDSLPLLHELLQMGFTCGLPVIEKGSRLLKFAAYKDGDALEQGPFELTQPVVSGNTHWVDPDIFVVPFLAFDRHGHRLGYGMGYYDTTLKHYRDQKPVIAAGYGYGQQAVLFNLPYDDHDQKLDWIITPQKAQRFKV